MWRMPLRDGTFVVYLEQSRPFKAYYDKEWWNIAPCGYWDGYQLNFPPGLMWQHPSDDSLVTQAGSLVGKGPVILWIEGALGILPCPFCRTVPSLHGNRSGSPGGGNGVVCGASPHEYNHWWMECCRWCNNMIGGFATAKELIETRNAVLEGRKP